MTTKTSWRKIASADDDVIAGELLEWSGLFERWGRYDMDRFYDFVSDVAEYCDHIEIEREEWDADVPGRSGTWHVVRTNDARQLRKEMRARVSELVRASSEKLKQARAEEHARQQIELKGPKQSELLCEASVWDDVFPTTYRIHIEVPDDQTSSFHMWEEADGRWKRHIEQISRSVGLREAARRFLLSYFGPTLGRDVMSFKAGPVFGEGEFGKAEYQDLVK